MAKIIRQNVVLGGFSSFQGGCGDPKYIYKKKDQGTNQQGYVDILRLEHGIYKNLCSFCNTLNYLATKKIVQECYILTGIISGPFERLSSVLKDQLHPNTAAKAYSATTNIVQECYILTGIISGPFKSLSFVLNSSVPFQHCS